VNGIPRSAEEITLFDLRGRPIAYISMDSDMTIHMWDGEPVAYLLVQNGIHHVYGFDGSHLGWFEDGVVRGRTGDIVGFIKGAVDIETEIEPLKGLKALRPLRSLREFPQLKPIYTGRGSVVPLSLFLKRVAD
jgi:hypothetical protein